MKRHLIALAALIILVMLFVSCSQEAEIVPEYEGGASADDTALDLNGQTIIYGMVKDYFFEGEDSTLTYINNTEFGDLAQKRMKDVEKKYNCDIVFQSVDRAGEYTYNNAMAGLYVFDMIQEESYYLVNYITTGAFVDLTTVSGLDVFDETKWGNRYLRMSTMWDGGIYGILPAQHPLRLQNFLSNIIAVNEKYVQDLVTTDPRDYFENGEWNWENFDSCLHTFAHTGGTTNEYVYAFGCCFEYGRFFMGVMMSNGLNFLDLKDDGSFSLGYFTPAAIEAYNQASEWLLGATAGSFKTDETGLNQFLDGMSVMTLIDSYQVLSSSTSIAYKMDNFGIVPFPYGPSASGPNDYRTSYESADFTIAIPSTARDPEVSSIVINDIYEPFEGFETDEKILDYLNRNYFLDERDSRFFLSIAEKEHTYYHDHMHGLSDMFGQLAKGYGVARAVESYESRYETIVAQYILTEYLTINEYADYFHE